MRTTSIKKFSILGLVLIGASAVTAAILPAKAKKGPGHPGRLVPNISTAVGGAQNQASCVSTEDPDIAQCNVTARSLTTNVGGTNPTVGTSVVVQASTSSIPANNTTNGFGNTNDEI